MKTVINGGNYYHEKAFTEICKALEAGKAVDVYIDVIGHSANNREQEIYKEALIQKYQDKLEVEKEEGAYSYSYTYRLR